MVTHSPPEKRPVITTTIPLDVFEEFVKECARLRINQPIANSCPYHARSIIAKLFELAQEEILLVSDNLLERDHNDVLHYAYLPIINQMKRFLRNPNARFSAIVQSGEIEYGAENKFLCEIVNDPERNGTVEIWLPQRGVLRKHVHHFIVVDGAMYRSESKDFPKDLDEPIGAMANFGDPKNAVELRNLFNELLGYLRKEPERVRKYSFERGTKFALN